MNLIPSILLLTILYFWIKASERKLKKIFFMPYKIKDAEYIVWICMKLRCYNKNDSQYKYYGGRGIQICDRWLESYSNFIEDMGARPTPLHTIDRISVDGNYEPDNCRWVTRAEQSRNKTNNVFITHNGETKCVKDWSDALGINDETIYKRLKRGLPIDKVLSKATLHNPGNRKGMIYKRKKHEEPVQ